MRGAFPLALATAMLASAGRAHADPEWNVAARPSLCRLGARSTDSRFAFCGDLTGDVLFGRVRNDAFGVGPFLTVGTARFSDARLSGGLSLLVPVPSGDFPLVVSGGALSSDLSDLRATASLFWGLRSHNFHGSYAMASGLVVGGNVGTGSARPTTLYLGLQIDGLWLTLPFILGYEWLRGSPD